MKKLLLKIIGALGYDLVRREPEKVDPADVMLRALVKKVDPVIFDVGANFGQSIKRFRGLFPQSTIHAFEPNPDTFKALSPYEGAGTILQQVAISDSEGEATLYLGPAAKLDSLHPINTASGNYDFANTAEKAKFVERTNREVQVPKSTLNAHCAANGIDKVDILKIDTQGHEIAVLAGANNILARTGIVLIEVAFWDYYDRPASSGFFDIEQYLKEAGFQLFALPRVSHEKHGLKKLGQVDAVYVNRSYLEQAK